MGNQIKWLEHDTNGQSWCSSTKVMGNLKCRELQLHRLFWWKKCTQFNDFFYGTLPKNQQVISFLKATMKRAKNIFMIVKFVLLCILFLTCFFFVKSVFQDFASRTSSMKRSLKKFDKVKFPTIGPTDFGKPFWVRGYKKHNTPASVQAKTHGKTRAGVVCFSLEPKTDFQSPWGL